MKKQQATCMTCMGTGKVEEVVEPYFYHGLAGSTTLGVRTFPDVHAYIKDLYESNPRFSARLVAIIKEDDTWYIYFENLDYFKTERK